jgi:uncharacterized cupin superfamily protein
MTGPTIPAIAYDADPATLKLTVRGPHKGAFAGAPVESVHVLHSDAGGRSGVWECTPGSFDSARNGDAEMMHFVVGAGTITTADGTAHEIRPGVVLVAPDGWRGTWVVSQTVRKVYTIWNTENHTSTTGEQP